MGLAPRALTWLWALASASALMGCALGGSGTTRLVDGVETRGRTISGEAYAYYARGVALESRGDQLGALAAFRSALAEDADAVEIRARLGLLECRLSTRAGDAFSRAAEADFARALATKAQSSTLESARAHCAAHQRRAREALSLALAAARLDPKALTLSLDVADYAEAAGEAELAGRWLDALLTFAPTSREAARALAAFAARRNDRARAARASARLAELELAPPSKSALADALAQRDLPRARQAAARLSLTPAALAARALTAGESELAGEQARLCLAADPSDINAWLVALVVADLEHEPDELLRLLEAQPSPEVPLDAQALAAFSRLLGRLLGSEAEQAFLRAQRSSGD